MKLKNHTKRQPLPSLQGGARGGSSASRQPLPSLLGGARGWVFVFFALLLTSCTLSMEEWTTPEEEKGFEEPETVETEYGTLTYQFKEGVRSITENIQEYIVRYEPQGENRILYFMDNTPQKWLPQKGDLVSAMCTPTLPFGLNHRVTSVKNIGGMYQVECEPATRDEIYEDLEFQFDGDYEIPGVAVYDSLTLDSLGINPDDLIIEDLSLLENQYGEQAMSRAGIHSTIRWRETPALKKLREAGIVSAGLTRADDDEDKQTEDDKEKKISSIFDNLNLTFNFGKGIVARIGGTYDKTDTEHVWYYESKKNDYRKQVTTSTSTSTWNINARIGKGRDPEKQNSPKDMTVHSLAELKDQLKQLKDAIKALPDKEKRQKHPLSFVNIHAPIGATGFFFVIKFNGGIDFEGGISGRVKFTSQDPVIESTYIYDKGVETTTPKRGDPEKVGIKQEGHTTVSEVAFAGELLFEVWIRAAIGVELGTKLGLGVDVGLKGTFGAQAKLDIAQFEQGKTIQVPDDPDGLKAYLSGELAATAYFSPAGINLFEAKTVFWNPYFYLLNEYFSPTVDKQNMNSSVEEENGKRKFHVDYRFSHVWSPLHGNYKHTNVPRLRVYHGDFKDNIYLDFKLDELETTEIARFDRYNFDFTDDDLLGSAAKYICVPCIYDYNTDMTYELRGAAKTFSSTGASIKFKKFKQKYGLWASSYLGQITKDLTTQEAVDLEYERFRSEMGLKKGDEKNWMYYEFGVTYDIKNINMYKEWGVNIEISRISGYKGKSPEYSPLFSKDVTALILNDDFVDVSKKNGTKTLVFRYLIGHDWDIFVTLKPYVISLKGKRTDFPAIEHQELRNDFYFKNDIKWGSEAGILAI